MIALLISILAGWIILSTFLVAIIFMTSSRLSHRDDPIKNPERVVREIEMKREEFA